MLFMSSSSLLVLLWFTTIAAVVCNSTRTITSYNMRDFSINPSTISITSFSFSEQGRQPEWVEHALGASAVYWRNQKDYHDYANNDYKEIPRARSNYLKYTTVRLPASAETPACFIEMLGFVRLMRHSPFRGDHDRFVRPATGTAVLRISGGTKRSTSTWNCYYRAVYENWRRTDHRNSFWSTFFYCPQSRGLAYSSDTLLQSQAEDAPEGELSGDVARRRTVDVSSAGAPEAAANNESLGVGWQKCMSFKERYGNGTMDVQMKLVMNLEKETTWVAKFDTYRDDVTDYARIRGESLTSHTNLGVPTKPLSPHLKILYNQSLMHQHNPNYLSAPSKLHNLAVCTAWPYATSHPDKIAANQALVYEFMRYYANLGMKVFVYDRDGANARGAFNTAYARANPQRGLYTSAVGDYLHYHNFTIHSLILPTENPELSDMEGTSKDDRMLYNNDRTLTYSHCRFEARVKYNIPRVILIDFDEFLYCKKGKPSPMGQVQYLQSYLHNMSENGLDQVSFGKATIAPRTSSAATGSDDLTSVSDCVQAQIQHNLRSTATAPSPTPASPSPQTSGTAGRCVGDDCGRAEHSEDEQLGSVFNCFASSNFIEAVPNVKSVQLNHKCPVSSMHHACAPCPVHKAKCSRWERRYEAYDCICESAFRSSCDFVHLSLVENKYKVKPIKDDARLAAVEASRSELWNVANAK